MQTHEKSFNTMIMAPSSASSSSRGIMEKHHHHQQQQQLQPLKCPRCDSSNTKFCYYNNYSLSQPRHFCKACKRYWTRGGTLRNVPVGGVCRKNKRVKRPTSGAGTVSSSSSINDGSSNSYITASAATNPNPQISQFSTTSSGSNNYMNMNPNLFSVLSEGGNTTNFPLIPSRFGSSKVSNGLGNSDFVSVGYHGLNALGLGFPPFGGDHFNGIMNPISGSLSSSSSPSLSAFLAANSFDQQKLINGGDASRNTQLLGHNHLQTLASLQDLQVGDNNEAGIAMNKEGKLCLDPGQKSNNNLIGGHMGLSSDPSGYSNWSSSTAVGAWFDPTNNIGSSLTSLI